MNMYWEDIIFLTRVSLLFFCVTVLHFRDLLTSLYLCYIIARLILMQRGMEPIPGIYKKSVAVSPEF